MEDRALGFAASAHAQLADAPAGPRLRRRGSGRVHGRRRAGRVPGALRRSRRRARAHQHHRHLGVAPAGRRLSGRDRRGELGGGCGRRGQRRLQPAAGAGGLGVAAGRARPGHPARLQASRPAAARSGARRRRLGHRPPARRRAAALRTRGDRSPWASTSACRGPTAAATSCGGSARSAGSTSATTRSTTSCARATSPRPSSSARPTGRTSTSTPSRDRGASLVGRFGAMNGGTASFSGSLRNVCNLADLKLKRLLNTIDQSAGLDEGPASRADAGRRPSARPDRPGRRGLRHRALGHRVPRRLLVAGRPGDRSQGRDPPRRRRGPHAPGLYRIGLNFLRRRKSSFIHGAEDDARELVEHLVGHLAQTVA